MFKKISESAKSLKNTRVMCAMAVLTALYVALYAVKIQITPQLRISFSFIPLALVGWLFGPIPAKLAGAVSDIIGALLFPSGAYFPGFTVTSMLSGFIYGACLYRSERYAISITISKILVNMLLHVLLNSYWLSLITGKGYAVYIVSHFSKNILALPVEVVLLVLIISFLHKNGIDKMYKSNSKKGTIL